MNDKERHIYDCIKQVILQLKSLGSKIYVKLVVKFA